MARSPRRGERLAMLHLRAATIAEAAVVAWQRKLEADLARAEQDLAHAMARSAT
jgi:hypothetical protein